MVATERAAPQGGGGRHTARPSSTGCTSCWDGVGTFGNRLASVMQMCTQLALYKHIHAAPLVCVQPIRSQPGPACSSSTTIERSRTLNAPKASARRRSAQTDVGVGCSTLVAAQAEFCTAVHFKSHHRVDNRLILKIESDLMLSTAKLYPGSIHTMHRAYTTHQPVPSRSQ
eukprot:6177872-Pleurochrysis_carterae.AAC.2